MRQWFVVWLVVFASFIQVEASDSPYLYYYSHDWNGWVIERADGSDSRLIGTGLMPESLNISWSEWSDSGEWLAWTAYNEGLGVPYAAHIDGQRHLTALEAYQDAVLAWSPAADQLFVVGSTAFEESGMQVRMQIIDAATDTVLNTREFFLEGEYHWVPFEVEWSGEFVTAVRYYENHDTRNLVYTMGADHFSETPVEWDKDYTIAPDGDVFYHDGGHLYRFDQVTGEVLDLGAYLCPDFYCVSLAKWNHDLSLALVSLEKANNVYELYLLDAAANTFERLNPTVQPVNYSFFFDPPPVGFHFWSPDGTSAAFVDKSGQLYRFDPAARALMPLLEGEKIAYKLWLAPQKMSVTICDETCRTLLLDGDTLTEVGSDAVYFVSPDGSQAVALTDTGIGNAPALLDLESGTMTPIPPHAGVTSSYREGEVIWKDGWFLILEYNPIGIGKGDILLSVGNGTGVRDLEYCNQFWQDEDGETGCGWLPDRTPIEKLAPSIDLTPPQPLLTLESATYIASLSFSPDGEKLALGSKFQGLNPVNAKWLAVWDLAAAERVQEWTETEVPEPSLTWIEDEKGGYEAQLGDPVEGDDFYLPGFQLAASQTRYLAYDIEDPPFEDEQCLRLFQYDLQTGERLFDLENTRKCDLDGNPIFRLNYSPDGRWIVGGGRETFLHIWDAETGQLAAVPHIWALSAVFNPDGIHLAVGRNQGVDVYTFSTLIED